MNIPVFNKFSSLVIAETFLTNVVLETTDSDKHWYVVLTRTNSERKVRDYFQLQEVDTFLPVQNRVIEREGKRIERERLLLPVWFSFISPVKKWPPSEVH